MEAMKNRLDELEIRVQKLEHELRVLKEERKDETKKNSLNSFMNADHVTDEPVLQPVSTATSKEEPHVPILLKENVDQTVPPKEKKEEPPLLEKMKDHESIIGKYLIGALASLLIFIAAASFIAMMWNKISPEIKLATVSMIGIALTAYGFRMTMKKASNISSIVFGTGIGLVYIAIVSANLVFSLISHEFSALLCVFWTLLILFSHRYTKLYFTILIAAIGSFINLCFELNYVESSGDYMFVISYTSAVAIMMLYMSHSLDKIRNAVSIFFAFGNFVLIFWEIFKSWDSSYYLEQTIVTLILLLLANWMYRLGNREDLRYTYFIPSFFSTFILYVNLNITLARTDTLNLTSLQASLIFFGVMLVQFIVNHIQYPEIEFPLTVFYAFWLYVGMIGINHGMLSVWGMGATPIMLLFFLRKKIWKKAIFIPYMMGFIVLDFLFSCDKSSVWGLSFNIVNLLLLFYFLFEEEVENLICKNIAVAMLLLGYFKIFRDICVLTKWDMKIWELDHILAYILSVITVITIYKIGYLSGNDEEQSQVRQHIGLYIFSVLLYFFGMREMFYTDLVFLRFIIMLTTLTIALFQSHLLLVDYEKIPNHIGIWLVAKYFIFTWVMMRAFWSLPFDSVSYSVVGLLLAVAAIYAGFKLGIKVIRQFGLSITMLMVVKFIFADLQGENSITRVLAFAIGGILCFAISLIYNHLSKE